MLDLRRLRLLRELSVRGTVTAVADALRHSPSAVSQQLAILEKEIGTPLFVRSGRRLQLTPAATVLVREAERLLDDVERVESTMRAVTQTVSGTLRVAAFQTAFLALLPPVLRRMAAQHPDVRVELVQHEPEAALRETWARGFDLVIAEQYPGHAAEHFRGLDRQVLTRDGIQLAVPVDDSGAVSGNGVRTLEDVAALPWVMEPRGAASRHWAEQRCRVAGFEPDVRFETADLQAHARLVESGNAVALLPSLVHAGLTPRVRLVDLPGDPCRTLFTAVREASALNPALASLRRFLGEAAQEG